MRHNSVLVIALAILINFSFAQANQGSLASRLAQVDAKDQTISISPDNLIQDDDEVLRTLLLVRDMVEEHGPYMLDHILDVTRDPTLSSPTLLKRDGDGRTVPLPEDQMDALDHLQKREVHKRAAQLSAAAKAQNARLQAIVNKAAANAKAVKAQNAANRATAENWLQKLNKAASDQENLDYVKNAQRMITIARDTAAMCTRNYGTFDTTFNCLMM